MPAFLTAALYQFVDLPDHAELRDPLLACCEAHGVKGTLLLAREGINGTIAGPQEGVLAVLAHLRADPRLASLQHKASWSEHPPFRRMKVRLKKEIVTLRVPGLDPNQTVGRYVKPQDWNALLADPDWRARARESWDTQAWDHSPLKNPQDLYLLDSENGAGPINITLKQYADDKGLHRSDAMADWILANGTLSTVHMAPFPKDEALTIELMRDPKTVGNISDAGAHLQMLCGGGENALLLTQYVRDDKSMTLEEAIHVMTGKLAEHFFLSDRGVIAPGKRADVVVFNLDEVQRQQMEKAWDMPDGKGGTTWRFTRKAMPTRLTMVNGEPTFENGAYTGAKPGRFLSPSNDDSHMAVAAE